MAGEVRLFEKDNGKMREVNRDAQGSRRISRVSLEIDVLWTAEEEVARDAEIAEAKRLADEQHEAERVSAEAAELAKTIAQAKLQPFLDATGLTADELKAVLGGSIS